MHTWIRILIGKMIWKRGVNVILYNGLWVSTLTRAIREGNKKKKNN